MASGDTLWVLYPQDQVGPGTLFATKDTVSDASAPIFSFPVLDFDGAADEHADFFETVPKHYAGGGFDWDYIYAMDGTDVDIVELELRMTDLVDASSVLTADLGVDGLTPSAIQDTPANATANEVNQTAEGTLSHANAGSPAVGAKMLIRVTRDISAATNTDDLQLLAIHIKET